MGVGFGVGGAWVECGWCVCGLGLGLGLVRRRTSHAWVQHQSWIDEKQCFLNHTFTMASGR